MQHLNISMIEPVYHFNSVGASALSAGLGFDPQLNHTKEMHKNGTSKLPGSWQ